MDPELQKIRDQAIDERRKKAEKSAGSDGDVNVALIHQLVDELGAMGALGLTRPETLLAQLVEVLEGFGHKPAGPGWGAALQCVRNLGHAERAQRTKLETLKSEVESAFKRART